MDEDRDQPGMTTVAVGERVNGDQAVMEARGDFVGRIAGVFDLRSNIAQ